MEESPAPTTFRTMYRQSQYTAIDYIWRVCCRVTQKTLTDYCFLVFSTPPIYRYACTHNRKHVGLPNTICSPTILLSKKIYIFCISCIIYFNYWKLSSLIHQLFIMEMYWRLHLQRNLNLSTGRYCSIRMDLNRLFILIIQQIHITI